MPLKLLAWFFLITVSCNAGTISFNTARTTYSGSPGAPVIVSGTISNNSGMSLNASDFAFDFSGYNPMMLTPDQLLGLEDFLIPDNATSSVVPLFQVSLLATTIPGQTYLLNVGLLDAIGDVGNSSAILFSPQSANNPVPEPNYVLIVGGLCMGLILLRHRRRYCVRLILHSCLSVVFTAIGLQAQSPQFVLSSIAVASTGQLNVTASLINNGTRGVSGVQITSEKLGAVGPNAASLPTSVGNMAPGDSITLPLQFESSAFTPGGKYLLTIRGTYVLDGGTYGFTVNSFLIVPGGASTAFLVVQTFEPDDSGTGAIGSPAGAGVYVKVNDLIVGQTDSSGTLTVQSSPGVVKVKAEVPSTSVGTATATLQAGHTTTVKVILDGDKEVTEDVSLVSPDINGGLLPSTSSALRFHFGLTKTNPITALDQIQLLTPTGSASIFLDQYFSLTSDGTIAATNMPGLMAILKNIQGKITLRIVGEDSNNFTYSNTFSFYIGRYSLQARLVAPPSKPGLKVSNIQLVASVLGSNIAFTGVSDSAGNVSFSSPFPLGLLSLKAQAFQDGMNYYGNAQFLLDANTTATVVLLSTVDLVNRVPPFTTTSSPYNPNSLLLKSSGRGRIAKPSALYATPFASSSNPSTATATAGPESQPISDTASLTVPKGTKSVNLDFTVQSQEYPFYVTQQSVYNDLWTINVTAGASGAQLFEETRNVNSQLAGDPLWQSTGSTGKISRVLDVSNLTANGPATLTVYVAATNIGDDQLSTTVSASLTGASLTINNITNKVDVDTQNDGTYYSIPRPSQSNTNQRTFDLDVSKPAGATYSKVQANISANGSNLGTVIDDTVGAPSWQIIDDQHIRVTITFGNGKTSSINSVPPPTYTYKYSFTVKATDTNGSELTSDTKESASMHALWRMPDNVPRYGARDPGLDDWCSRSTYNWILTNQSLLTRVDDVSGEHGIDIGHNTHERGTDIDNFHFYTLPGGSASGKANYAALASAALGALNGDANSKAQLNSWVTNSRSGLNKLLANTSVDYIYHAIGSSTSKTFPQPAPKGSVTISLKAGWARDLLRLGTITASSGQTLDLGLGAWNNSSSAKMRYNATHNSHVHIALIESGQ